MPTTSSYAHSILSQKSRRIPLTPSTNKPEKKKLTLERQNKSRYLEPNASYRQAIASSDTVGKSSTFNIAAHTSSPRRPESLVTPTRKAWGAPKPPTPRTESDPPNPTPSRTKHSQVIGYLGKPTIEKVLAKHIDHNAVDAATAAPVEQILVNRGRPPENFGIEHKTAVSRPKVDEGIVESRSLESTKASKDAVDASTARKYPPAKEFATPAYMFYHQQQQQGNDARTVGLAANSTEAHEATPLPILSPFDSEPPGSRFYPTGPQQWMYSPMGAMYPYISYVGAISPEELNRPDAAVDLPMVLNHSDVLPVEINSVPSTAATTTQAKFTDALKQAAIDRRDSHGATPPAAKKDSPRHRSPSAFASRLHEAGGSVQKGVEGQDRSNRRAAASAGNPQRSFSAPPRTSPAEGLAPIPAKPEPVVPRPVADAASSPRRIVLANSYATAGTSMHSGRNSPYIFPLEIDPKTQQTSQKIESATVTAAGSTLRKEGQVSRVANLHRGGSISTGQRSVSAGRLRSAASSSIAPSYSVMYKGASAARPAGKATTGVVLAADPRSTTHDPHTATSDILFTPIRETAKTDIFKGDDPTARYHPALRSRSGDTNSSMTPMARDVKNSKQPSGEKTYSGMVSRANAGKSSKPIPVASTAALQKPKGVSVNTTAKPAMLSNRKVAQVKMIPHPRQHSREHQLKCTTTSPQSTTGQKPNVRDSVPPADVVEDTKSWLRIKQTQEMAQLEMAFEAKRKELQAEFDRRMRQLEAKQRGEERQVLHNLQRAEKPYGPPSPHQAKGRSESLLKSSLSLTPARMAQFQDMIHTHAMLRQTNMDQIQEIASDDGFIGSDRELEDGGPSVAVTCDSSDSLEAGDESDEVVTSPSGDIGVSNPNASDDKRSHILHSAEAQAEFVREIKTNPSRLFKSTGFGYSASSSTFVNGDTSGITRMNSSLDVGSISADFSDSWCDEERREMCFDRSVTAPRKNSSPMLDESEVPSCRKHNNRSNTISADDMKEISLPVSFRSQGEDAELSSLTESIVAPDRKKNHSHDPSCTSGEPLGSSLRIQAYGTQGPSDVSRILPKTAAVTSRLPPVDAPSKLALRCEEVPRSLSFDDLCSPVVPQISPRPLASAAGPDSVLSGVRVDESFMFPIDTERGLLCDEVNQGSISEFQGSVVCNTVSGSAGSEDIVTPYAKNVSREDVVGQKQQLSLETSFQSTTKDALIISPMPSTQSNAMNRGMLYDNTPRGVSAVASSSSPNTKWSPKFDGALQVGNATGSTLTLGEFPYSLLSPISHEGTAHNTALSETMGSGFTDPGLISARPASGDPVFSPSEFRQSVLSPSIQPEIPETLQEFGGMSNNACNDSFLSVDSGTTTTTIDLNKAMCQMESDHNLEVSDCVVKTEQRDVVASSSQPAPPRTETSPPRERVEYVSDDDIYEFTSARESGRRDGDELPEEAMRRGFWDDHKDEKVQSLLDEAVGIETPGMKFRSHLFYHRASHDRGSRSRSSGSSDVIVPHDSQHCGKAQRGLNASSDVVLMNASADCSFSDAESPTRSHGDGGAESFAVDLTLETPREFDMKDASSDEEEEMEEEDLRHPFVGQCRDYEQDYDNESRSQDNRQNLNRREHRCEEYSSPSGGIASQRVRDLSHIASSGNVIARMAGTPSSDYVFPPSPNHVRTSAEVYWSGQWSWSEKKDDSAT